MTTTPALPRLRGAVVGGTSAFTGVGAHAAAQGMLPDTSTLMLVAATAVALGFGVAAAPGFRSLPALVAGQGLVHGLLVLTSGHHHDLLTAPMAVMHTVGTVAALLLLIGVEHLVAAVAATAVRVASVGFRPADGRSVASPLSHRPFTPTALVFLGAVGQRGPPLSIQH